MHEIIQSVQSDAAALLNRALLGKTIGFFGMDGNGQHGRDYFAHYRKVNDVTVFVKTYSDDMSEMDCVAMIFMDDYDAKAHGHALSDQNFRLSLNTLLKAQDIDVKSLDWASLEEQGDNCVVMAVNLEKLLEW